MNQDKQSASDAAKIAVDGPEPTEASNWQRFKTWYLANRKISIPATLLLLLLIVFGWPTSRYATTGLLIKKDLTITLKDSETHTPVSGADVSWGNQNAISDANGRAILHKIKPGPKRLLVAKKYYKDSSPTISVPVLKSQPQAAFAMVATGRQVRIKALDYVDGSALSDVSISISDTNAKTDKKGVATVVVPAGSTTEQAILSKDGYNNQTADIKVSGDKVEENTVKLTPAGKVYFFSKRTGKLDLMKANLDSSGSKVVLAGTGYETVNQAAIWQSPDWKYVALLLRRSPADQTPQLYVLKTDDDQLISVENGKANFGLNGWSGDKLVYTASRTDLPGWQTGQTKLKSYDAGSGKITLLDQQQGSDSSTNINEVYNNVLVSGDKVVYSKYWGGDITKMVGKQDSVQMIDADGQNHKIVATYDAATDSQQVALHTPTSFYISLTTNNDFSNSKYYEFSFNNPLPKEVSINAAQFYPSTLNYYQSPSGTQLLWSELRDGKNTILVGDQSGGNPAIIGRFSDYQPFGWSSERYVLLAKNNNELYVMNLKGSRPLKITDYQYTNSYY